MIRFEGEVGNNYSTVDNPFGIIKTVDYCILEDMFKDLGMNSARHRTSRDSVIEFKDKKKVELLVDKNEIDAMENKDYTSQSKINLDNAYVIYNAKKSEFEVLNSIIERLSFNYFDNVSYKNIITAKAICDLYVGIKSGIGYDEFVEGTKKIKNSDYQLALSELTQKLFK